MVFKITKEILYLMKKEMKKLGLLGFGSFGQFMVKHLVQHFEVVVWNRSPRPDEAKSLGVKQVSVAEACDAEIVIPCVPVQFLEKLLVEMAPNLKPDTWVVDVSSVKVRPLEMMERILPNHVQIIGTHPLFGPMSGKNGIEGLNMVICPSQRDIDLKLVHFFEDKLKLNVLIRTPEVHDQQMAYVQALTHFIGRAVNAMDIPDVEQKTKAYQFLLEIKQTLGKDSLDLFYTIEKENPYAQQVREDFLKALTDLNESL